MVRGARLAEALAADVLVATRTLWPSRASRISGRPARGNAKASRASFETAELQRYVTEGAEWSEEYTVRIALDELYVLSVPTG